MCPPRQKDDQLSDSEIRYRMERGLKRAVSTPPKPHGKNPNLPRKELLARKDQQQKSM
jgi:hypothetical protein